MCSLYDYTANVYETDGTPILDEIECELSISTDVSGGEFDLTVVGVMRNGCDLFRSHDSGLLALGLLIAGIAEQDGDFIVRVMAGEGISLAGAGYNNPDSQFVRART